MVFYLQNLLRNEYFPLELPPCFSSDSFADKFDDINTIVINCENEFKKTNSIPAAFSGYKKDRSRRRFSVPNPFHYYKAVKLITDNSSNLFSVFNCTSNSLTCPIDKKPTERFPYMKRSMNIADTKAMISKLYKNNLYEVRIDISSCFDSIYTHSISWAIHGKSEAKRRKNDNTLLGNKIDIAIRNMNSNQTNGILIGNAVSRIVSEIILCTIDKNINEKLKDVDYCRYVDDYFIYAKTTGEINNIINQVTIALQEYQFNINESKVQINEAPFVYGRPYVEEINTFVALKTEVFLNKLIIHYQEYNDIAIMKYGLKVLLIREISKKDWEKIQSIIMNLWVRFPSLSNIFIKLINNNIENVSKSLLKKTINSIIDNNIVFNNDQEIIWAVWASKLFNIPLSQVRIEKIFDSLNQFAIIILLDIMASDKKYKAPFYDRLKNKLKSEILEHDVSLDNKKNNLFWSQFWLISYEADINKWLNTDPENPFQYCRKNRFFKALKEIGVDFYNGNYTLEATEKERSKKATIYLTKEEFNLFKLKLKDYLKTKNTKEGFGSNTENNTEAVDDGVKEILTYLESDIY